jgi:hypothetical protein
MRRVGKESKSFESLCTEILESVDNISTTLAVHWPSLTPRPYLKSKPQPKSFWYPNADKLLKMPYVTAYDSPLGGNLAVWTSPALVIRTHFNVARYDHAPSHLSRNITLFVTVRSGRSRRESV